MTDTTKKTYTIEELCKLRGIELTKESEHIHPYFEIRLGTLFYGCDRCNSWQHILSPSDTIPSDECGKCGKNEALHKKAEYCTRKKFEFKPLSLTVKSIRLVETCKCGKPKSYHHLTHEKMEMDDDSCEGYEPVQKVEVDFE